MNLNEQNDEINCDAGESKLFKILFQITIENYTGNKKPLGRLCSENLWVLPYGMELLISGVTDNST